MDEQNAQRGSDNLDQNSQDENNELPKFQSRLGLPEEVFVRLARKQGNYAPVVHQIMDLVIKGLITHNESRLLFYIFSKTVYFRETDTRLKRKQIQETLSLSKPKLQNAITSLVAKAYLLEVKDKDNFYFYGLNPIAFDGVIVFGSLREAAYRMNRSRKPVSFLSTYSSKKPKGVTKLVTEWYQKGIEVLPKWYQENDLNIRYNSSSSLLKYTLTKYTLINGLTTVRTDKILEVLNSLKCPEFGIKQLVVLMQKNPRSIKAITEELLRAHREGTDYRGKKVYPNPLMYVVGRWDEIKHAYSSFPDHVLDMSDKAVQERLFLEGLIAEYPIEENKDSKVIPFHVG